MKLRKAEILRRVHAVPHVRFDPQQLTSFGGLVLFQSLFAALDLAARLRRCFAHLGGRRVYGLARVVLQLVVHVLLGFRRMRDRDYYADDPLVCRVLGLRRLPDVATLSRTLATADERSVDRVRGLVRDLVLDRVQAERLPRVTADFDGSVNTTQGHAEGSAVGFNLKHKGARSYYPLLCTLGQVGQFLDVLHRPGNVHDSNGALAFMEASFLALRERLPRAVLECRLDAAFFDDAILGLLEDLGVEYAVAVPFMRFPYLRYLVDSRCNWRRLDDRWSYFELDWRPKSWSTRRRLVLIRQRQPVRRKGPLQLDLFEPVDHEFQYKVIVTNKPASPAAVLHFFNGRGIQEATFAEAKQFAALDYIPCRRLVANRLWTLSAMLAHNLARELQMRAAVRARRSTPTRAPLFAFRTLGTLRHLLLRRAARLARPAGRLTLTVAASGTARRELEHHLRHLHAA